MNLFVEIENRPNDTVIGVITMSETKGLCKKYNDRPYLRYLTDVGKKLYRCSNA